MAITKASDLAKLLADGVVGTTEIGDGQITTAKIADSAITTDKLASNAVTAAQLSVSGNDIPYDNTISGMSANTLQEAIDYLNVVTGGGSAGAQATYTRDSFTATEGQTVFTTSNGYTLGYVQVFMNGVLLALTDYVANNETTVVLNVGASAGDEIVIVAYDSFAISEVLRVLNLSASAPDDSITLTGAGDLLIGKTSGPNYNAVGVDITALGEGQFTGDNRAVLQLNRQGSSGDVAVIRQGGQASGVIGTYNYVPYIGYAGPSGGGIMFNGLNINPTGIGYQRTDGSNDIGQSNYRFKDLYLSGGVYLGGTSASNHLDDYEEGTFTPFFSYGTTGVDLAGGSYAFQRGYYRKVGSVVYYILDIQSSSIANTSPGTYRSVGGLPFPNGNYSYPASTFRDCTAVTVPSGNKFAPWVQEGATYLYLQSTSLTTGSTSTIGSFDSSGRLNISGFYFTDS